VLEYFSLAARKLSSYPFVAVLALVALVVTRLEPLKSSSPAQYGLYLIFAVAGLFLMIVFHHATRIGSIYIQVPAVVLILTITLCFSYIIVAITSRAFGGPWQPCILMIDEKCPPAAKKPKDSEGPFKGLGVPALGL
jgi:hypothetical protein